jgi:hypothetical protein
LVLLFCSCTNDDSKEIELTERQQLQNKFSLANFDDDFIKNNLVVDWNDFVLNINKDTISDTKVYEFNTSFKVSNSLASGKLKLAVKYKLLVSRNDTDPWKFEIVKFLSSESDPIDLISHSSPSSFSGTLYHYNLNGENTKMIAYKKGKVISKFLNKVKLASSITAKEPSIGGDTGGFWMFTRTQHYTDWYQTSNYSQGVYTYTHSTYNYTSSEYVWVSTGGNSNTDYHNHSSSSHGPSPSEPTNNHLEEIIIDTSFLNTKVECIYNKLMNSNTGFKNAIQKFDGEFPVSHLKLTINNDLEPNVYGQTLPPVSYVTEIQFSDKNFSGLSDLAKATVFAHETIHAEIFRKMLSAAQRGTLNSNTTTEQINLVNSLKDNFPGLYDYYEKRWKPNWNHEMMANHYRKTIADIIQEFDNNRLPRSTYEAVSWVGLGVLDKDKGLTTIAWDNLTPEQKTVINNLIRDNFYNGPSNCN